MAFGNHFFEDAGYIMIPGTKANNPLLPHRHWFNYSDPNHPVDIVYDSQGHFSLVGNRVV